MIDPTARLARATLVRAPEQEEPVPNPTPRWATALLAAVVLTAAPTTAQGDSAAGEGAGGEVPHLALRLAPGQAEVYERETTLALDQQYADGHFVGATRLRAELVATPEEPLGGAWPVELAAATLEASVEATFGEREWDATYALPEDMAGYGVTVAVAPTGQRAGDDRMPFGRLPEAPSRLSKRAMIDFAGSSFLGAGRLPDEAVREWEATSELVLPGEGWDGDYVGLALRERYTVEGVDAEGVVTIRARLVEASISDGPWFTFDRERYEREGSFSGGRWLQALFALDPEGAELTSERTIRFDAGAGVIRSAEHRLAIRWTWEERTFGLERVDRVERSANAAAVARLEAARAAEPPRYRVTTEAALTPAGAEAPDALVRLEGRLQTQRREQDGRWIGTFDALTARVVHPAHADRSEADVTFDLAGNALFGDVPMGMIVEQKVLELFTQQLEGTAEPYQVQAALDLCREGALGARGAFPWDLVRAQGLDAPDAERARLRLLEPPREEAFDPQLLLRSRAGNERTFAVERIAPDHLRLVPPDDADAPATADGPEVDPWTRGLEPIELRFDPEDRYTTGLEVRRVLELADGSAYRFEARWERVE